MSTQKITAERIIRKCLEKRAAWNVTTLLPSVSDIGHAVTDIGSMAAAYMVAAAVLGGAGLGWVGAKVTAKGERDTDTAKKSYEGERLKADIGYLQSKIQQEADAQKRKLEQKPMRLI